MLVREKQMLHNPFLAGGLHSNDFFKKKIIKKKSKKIFSHGTLNGASQGTCCVKLRIFMNIE